MANLIDDKTPNLQLPLPHPQNLMPTDCNRIRQAITGLDAAVESAKEKADAALPKSGGEVVGDIFRRVNWLMGTKPTSSAYAGFLFKDANNKVSATVQNFVETDGQLGIQVQARNPLNPSDSRRLLVGFDANGNGYSSAPHPAPTTTALTSSQRRR